LRTLVLLLYNLLLPFGLVCMLPGAFVKMRRRGGRWRDLAQRLGFHSPETRAAIAALPRGRLWMHAVSVGEVNVARKLIKSLLHASPDTAVVLTTTTPTGLALAKECEKQHAGRVVAIYSPVDLPGVPGRMLDLIKPRHRLRSSKHSRLARECPPLSAQRPPPAEAACAREARVWHAAPDTRAGNG
jgi:3-deoxy-D-manno-octulosonic-acid transferase